MISNLPRILQTCVVASVLLATAPSPAFAASADLSIDKAASADPVAVGSQLTYTLTVTNAGPDTAIGVEVSDELPSRLDFVSSNPSQGSCKRTGKKVTCSLGSLANAAGATVELVVTPRKAGQIVNAATVSGIDPDPVAANNTDSETTTVIEPPPPPTCGGEAATLVGTVGDDQLVGTEKHDVIVSFAGNDVVRGLGGGDLICTAAGNDAVLAGSGNDLVRGGGGADKLRGGRGSDVLRAKGGPDSISGAGGADVLRGGGGADTCAGGPGRDVRHSC